MAQALRGADWAPDGMIYFGSPGHGVSRVPASGGTPQPVTTPDRTKGEDAHWWPKLLPGGKEVLFTIRTSETEAHIAVESPATHKRGVTSATAAEPETVPAVVAA